jgi:hypothetical protein
MEGGVVGSNFERDPPRGHPFQVWFNFVQWFQRRRFKRDQKFLQMSIAALV